MTNLMKIEQNLTMTSREIAELTGKRHPDVKRDIENMMLCLEQDMSSFARIYSDPMNRQQTEYLLDKELTMTLVAGYNVKLRHAIVKRWQELEGQIQKPMTQIEMILASATLLANMEKRQLEVEHDCDDCGRSWARGAIAFVDGNKVFELIPNAHC